MPISKAMKARGKYTRSGIRRAGDDYQDVVALELFVEMLAHPSRYEWVELEADEAGALDDIVALRRDGTIVARQVKFTGYSESAKHSLDWSTLLDTGKSDESWLKKWADSLSLLRAKHQHVEAYLITNMPPSEDLRAALAQDRRIDLEKVASEVRECIHQQLGSEDAAKSFFSIFEFRCDHPDLPVVHDCARKRFLDLDGEPFGWERLSSEIRVWVRERQQPSPDGRITLAAIKSACLWQVPEPLAQDFPIPDDFVVPSAAFHDEFVSRISQDDGWFVLAASPGSGKSTYLSHLVEELAATEILVIRHHIFLDWNETSSGERREHQRIAESLISDLQRLYPQLRDLLPGNPRARRLSAWLTTASDRARAKGGALVLILDGLDHVWRNDKSVAELDRLFDLLPSCEGFRLVVGTQPVEDTQLPQRLLDLAPREEWLQLPRWDIDAVRSWINHHREDLPPSQRENPAPPFLNDLVEAIKERGGGQPLYLRYALQALVEAGRALSAEEFRKLPQCPQGNITRYYDQLWRSLGDEGRRILYLMASCPFPWPNKGILQALDPSGGASPAIQAGLRQILHLVEDKDGGLLPVHSSLTIYTRNLVEYSNCAGDLQEKALKWLRSAAPPFWKWAYEWTLEDELGNSEPLLENPSRAWLIDSVATLKPPDVVNNILAAAADIALNRRRIGRFVELGLLADYYNNAINYSSDIVDDMVYSQLRSIDEDVPIHRIWTDPGVGSGVLVDLAEFFIEQGESFRGSETFNVLDRRLKQEEYEDPRHLLSAHTARAAAMADVVSAGRVARAIRRQRASVRYELLHNYLRELRASRKGKDVKEFLVRTRRWPRGIRRCILHEILPFFCEEAMRVPQEGIVESDLSSPIGAVVEQLSGRGQAEPPGVILPEGSSAEFRALHFGDRDSVLSYFYQEVFFGALANSLLRRENQTSDYIDSLSFSPWTKLLLGRLVGAAESIRSTLEADREVPYDVVYSALADIDRPPGAPLDEDHNYWHAARRALIEISNDLRALSSRRTQPKPVSCDEIKRAFNSAMFNVDIWLRSVVARRRSILSEEGVRWVIDRCRGDLAGSIDPCAQRAQQLSRLANFASVHHAKDDARLLLADCAAHLIAYGDHKDLLLHLAVEETDFALTHGLNSDGLAWIERLAPAVAEVRWFTDGDETRHVPSQLGHVLAKHSPGLFAKYYRWLVDQEEYYDAQDVFGAFVEFADLSVPINRYLVATSVDAVSLSKLASRLDRGDPGAVACADLIRVVVVPRAEIDDASSTQSPIVTSDGIDESLYGPDALADLVDAASSRTHRDVLSAVRRWATLWTGAGKGEQVLEALDREDERSRLSGDYMLKFEIALEVEGRQGAFERLVAGYAAASGWSPYYRHEDAKAFWRAVKEHYPDRWWEFLLNTVRSERIVYKYRVSAYGSHSRLMEFCLEMGQQEMAREIGEVVVGTVVQLVSPLPLSQPEWTAHG